MSRCNDAGLRRYTSRRGLVSSKILRKSDGYYHFTILSVMIFSGSDDLAIFFSVLSAGFVDFVSDRHRRRGGN